MMRFVLAKQTSDKETSVLKTGSLLGPNLLDYMKKYLQNNPDEVLMLFVSTDDRHETSVERGQN